MSAYTQLKDAITGILPNGWSIKAYEPLAEVPDATTVTLKVRRVSRLPEAPMGAYRVDWILTVTSPTPSRETADPTLFDDLIDLLIAIDNAPDLEWLSWTDAKKTVGDDEQRLAYDITIRTQTAKEA